MEGRTVKTDSSPQASQDAVPGCGERPGVHTPHQVWLLQLDSIFQVGDQCGAGTLADLVPDIMSTYTVQ
jgi:hypothetical protein